MKIHHLDHVGVIVDDLAAVKAFFLDLGLEVQGEGEVDGAWVDQIVGLQDVKLGVIMMQMPGGQAKLELIKYYAPADASGVQRPQANTLGIRHIAFAVEDIDAIVAKLQRKGWDLFGTLQRYEDLYKLCYVRGPEGIIIELAEQIK